MTADTAAHAAPFFTVFMAVWNAKPFIGLAMASVLAQDFADFELVVADDCSTDGTWAIIEDAARRDPRIRPYRARRRREGLANYLSLYRSMRGEVVVEVDGDDVLGVPWALSRIRSAYLDPEVDATYGNAGRFLGNHLPGEMAATVQVTPPRGARVAAPWCYWATRSWRRAISAQAPWCSYFDIETRRPWMWPRDAALFYPVVVHGRKLVHIPETLGLINGANLQRTPLLVGTDEMNRKGAMIYAYWLKRERELYPEASTVDAALL